MELIADVTDACNRLKSTEEHVHSASPSKNTIKAHLIQDHNTYIHTCVRFVRVNVCVHVCLCVCVCVCVGMCVMCVCVAVGYNFFCVRGMEVRTKQQAPLKLP